MNKKQIEELKEKLEENKSSLEKTLQNFAKKDDVPKGDWDAVFPKQEGSDMDEKADEVEEYSSLLPVEHALEIKLRNINIALKKIAEGRYGKCENCGKEISYKKLSFVPETKKCRDCS